MAKTMENTMKMPSEAEVIQPAFETPVELAKRLGLPVANIRHLIKTNQLDHLHMTPGKRNPKIPAGSWERYLQACVTRGHQNGGNP